MSPPNLTDEQRAVVEHPVGSHARVLAVAGSGKTTTLVSRVAHLVGERHVAPERILVLMFNTLARQQFKEKAAEVGLPPAFLQRIHTFHSFAYTSLKGTGALPSNADVWIDDKIELQRRCLHAAISELEKAGLLGAGEIDPEEAMGAIGMWKGALVPPDRAGYRGHERMPLVYRTFERLRTERHGLSFDDFVPMALESLATAPPGSGKNPRFEYVIVDEYQDVNLGQQVLVETVAGRDAEVMVVGDDDQTIYEWRGARPDYIQHLFPLRFPERETRTYTLTFSFRFGPKIAQCADNVIQNNVGRHPKAVVARDTRKRGLVSVVDTHSEQSADVDGDLCREILRLRDAYLERGITDLRGRVVVLGRTFSQMAGLEGEFLRRSVPYCVVGRAPFLERHEVVTLLDYVRVAHRFDVAIDKPLADALSRIVNTPNRRVPSADVRHAVSVGANAGWTPRRALRELIDDKTSPLSKDIRARVSELVMRLERLGELIGQDDMGADDVLAWLINAVDYQAHFRSYFGNGEDSFERLSTLDALRQFARQSTKSALAFVEMVDRIDPTQGAPKEQQVVFTTVHRTKGLEYDHVVIPSCVEGMMPVHGGSESLVYDTAEVNAEPTSSAVLENERRLFYVAITRAREQVLIGTVEAPKKGAQANSKAPTPSRFLEEIRLRGAEAIGGGITRCHDQESVTRYVREAIAAYQADRSLGSAIRNAATRYLPDIGYPRAAERLARLLAEAPEAPFSYSRPYPSIEHMLPLKLPTRAMTLPPAPSAVAPEDPEAVYD